MIRNRIYEQLFMNRVGDIVRCRSQRTIKQLLQSHTHCSLATCMLSKHQEVTCMQFEEDFRVPMFDGLKLRILRNNQSRLTNSINFMFRTRNYTFSIIPDQAPMHNICVLPSFFFYFLSKYVFNCFTENKIKRPDLIHIILCLKP